MPELVYISQDGPAPSGITSYGLLLLQHCPASRMLLLNAIEVPESLPPRLAARIHCIPPGESHRVEAVADRLSHVTMLLPGPTVVLPNAGDTPWSAAALWWRRLALGERNQRRVLGILHSDVETQYACAQLYGSLSPVWIGVSRRCAEELRRRVASQGVIVHELPYPMELDDQPSRTSGARGALRIGYVGRLEEPQKRVSRLVALLSRLARTGTDFFATIVGDGPAREAVVAGIAHADDAVQRRTVMTGTLDRAGVKALWLNHDVCLLTSSYEGMPFALLEAMAAGVCPVVMAVESGLPELILDGVNGRVVPQGDVEAMARVIAELHNDRDQLARLGRAARETVANRFSPEVHFRRLREITDELWTFPPPKPDAVGPGPTANAVHAIVAEAKRLARPVTVFGAGMFGRKVVDALQNSGIAVCGLFDSDPARQGMRYAGLSCEDPATMPASTAVVVIGSIEFAAEMRQRVLNIFSERGDAVPTIVAAPR